MAFLNTLLNIIIFLLCLSFVVCLHEAGHLIAAKSFKVYCYEYSIGFGHKIVHKRFRHKRKKPLYDGNKGIQEMNVSQMVQAEPSGKVLDEQEKRVSEILSKNEESKPKEDPNYEYGETYFSIGILPLGGYVAMAGEDGEDFGDVKVPKERTLTGINHAKQIVIMMAGIVMNFILAWILFFADFAFCNQSETILDTNAVTVSEKLDNKTTKAYEAGLRTGDKILTLYQTYSNLCDEYGKTIPDKTFFFPSDENRKDIVSYMNEDAVTADDYSKDSLAYAIQDVIAHNMDSSLTPIPGFEKMQIGDGALRTIHFTYYSAEKQTELRGEAKLEAYKSSDGTWTFEKFGISPATRQFRYSAGEAFVNAGREFHYLFVNIYKAVGSIFTPAGWKNMGGIISVYRVSAQGVSSGSAGYFLLLWGYISLNLGCFNLLPFPGLDGWQTLLALIETVSRKKVSTKVKGICNTVGMILLMLLAGVLLFKDIFVR